MKRQEERLKQDCETDIKPSVLAQALGGRRMRTARARLHREAAGGSDGSSAADEGTGAFQVLRPEKL